MNISRARKSRKPLLVNLTWSGAIVLVLLAFYVAAFGVAAWMYGVGYISFETDQMLSDTVFRPLSWYIVDTDYPGSDALSKLYSYCFWAGAERDVRQSSRE